MELIQQKICWYQQHPLYKSLCVSQKTEYGLKIVLLDAIKSLKTMLDIQYVHVMFSTKKHLLRSDALKDMDKLYT